MLLVELRRVRWAYSVLKTMDFSPARPRLGLIDSVAVRASQGVPPWLLAAAGWSFRLAKADDDSDFHAGIIVAFRVSRAGSGNLA
jgi:hypothetical protein